jgi:hypothetical protein
MSYLSGSSLTSPPTKIHLNSTTKVSLHDRFTKLAKTKSQEPVAVNQSLAIKSPKLVLQASARNRNLALHMSSRPAVQAALKIKNKSIKQRLGQIQPRLNSNSSRNKFEVNSIQSHANLINKQNMISRKIDPLRLRVGVTPLAIKNNLNRRLGGGVRVGGAIGNSHRHHRTIRQPDSRKSMTNSVNISKIKFIFMSLNYYFFYKNIILIPFIFNKDSGRVFKSPKKYAYQNRYFYYFRFNY